MKKVEIVRTCITHGEMRNACKILVGKTEGNRPLGGPRRRRWDNIRMDFTEIGWEVVDWFHLDQERDRGRGSCKHGNELSGSIKCRKFRK
jgi:hypothetical protein